MDNFALISSAAHDGAFGKNARPEPTLAQLRAGNYVKGRCTLHGLKIAIETPQGHRRTGKASGEPWSVICMAHYGYIEKTRGADGDELDVFIGPWPESERVWVVNRAKAGGEFEEHKILLAFPDAESAITAYRNSYERGSANDASVVPCTIDQLKWWIAYGNHAVALTANQLPYDGTAVMNDVTWDSTATPIGTSLPALLYAIRQQDAEDHLLLDAVTAADILEASDGEAVLDALVVPLNRLERKLAQMQVIMRAAAKGVKPVAAQITPPFKQRGTTNVAAIIEMSDGQTVSIYFHNPDTTPNKLTPDDEMVSWKWMLNKKDVTIVVAPERGQELNPREVARRIMRLVEANSARFQKANTRRSERMASIEATKTGIAEKEARLAALDTEIDSLEVQVEAKRNKPPAVLQSGDQYDTDARLREVREAMGRLGWNVSAGILEMTVRIDGSIYGVKAFATSDYLRWEDTGSDLMWEDEKSLTADQMAAKIDSEFRRAIAAAKAQLVNGRSGSLEDQAAADAALAMAAQVVADLGGTFATTGSSGEGVAGAWSYGDAKVNGMTINLAASGGGVVQVNRKPHDPDGAVITTPEQVRRSILAVAPEQSAEPPIEGNNDEVVAILANHIPALLAALSARHPLSDRAEKIEVDVLGYSDLSIKAISQEGRASANIAFANGDNYKMVADIIGPADAEQIKAIINALKANAADRNASGYWKSRPFNKVEKVVLRWSEGSMDANREFADLDALQDWFRTTYRTDEIRPAGATYSKNSILVTLSNIDGEMFNIEPRLDVSDSAHDFNPYRETVAQYLRRLGYDGETPRKAGVHEMYVDVPLGSGAGSPDDGGSDPVVEEAVRLVREAKGGIAKLATSDYFTFEFEGDDMIFGDELRAQVEAALGEKVKEVTLPGLEGQVSIVPESFSPESKSGAGALLTEAEVRAAGKRAVEFDSYLKSVIDGTTDLSDPEVADKLTALYEANNGNPTFDEMFAKAADAYQTFMVEAAKKALGN